MATDGQTTAHLVREIAVDTGALVRKEVELAKQEVLDAVTVRLRAAASYAVAGLFVLMALVFGALAGAEALEAVVEPWAARLMVCSLFAMLAVGTLATGLVLRAPKPLEETKRTLKEDVQWARRQLKR